MTVAIERMKAMVTTGNRNWRTVCRKARDKAAGLVPERYIGTKARSAAKRTSVPAVARKSSRYVNAYGPVFAATGGSRCTRGVGLPSTIRYAPGQLNSHTGKRTACGSTDGGVPTQGSGHILLPPWPHRRSDVTFAGGGTFDIKAKLPDWPTSTVITRIP